MCDLSEISSFCKSLGSMRHYSHSFITHMSVWVQRSRHEPWTVATRMETHPFNSYSEVGYHTTLRQVRVISSVNALYCRAHSVPDTCAAWRQTMGDMPARLLDSKFLCCVLCDSLYSVAWGCAILSHVLMTVMNYLWMRLHANAPRSTQALAQARPTMPCILLLKGTSHLCVVEY